MDAGETYPLIWSLSRKLRRNFCPRAAVIHYREARRGAEPEASERDRTLNRLHRIVPESKYLRQLLLRVMRESFYRGEDDPDALAVSALKRCDEDFRRMVFGNAPLLLDKLHRCEQGVTELRRALSDRLLTLCRRLGAGAWRELLTIPAFRRRFIASPLHFHINELECYASPLLAYADRGVLRIVELRTGSLAEYPEILLMHRLYAQGQFNRFPEAVRSCQLDPETGEFREIAADFDLSATLKTMSADAAGHRAELALGLAEIPVNTVNCGQCVFASFCGDNFQRKET